jgi:glycosyltransferase involved in cell wall biosynthesis
MSDTLRVAVLARAVYPAHGYGGLERHVFDLVRHLSLRGVAVTLVTRTGAAHSTALEAGAGPVTLVEVPYRTFPLAGRAGTTILDRDTAYPLFGWRAGRRALEAVRRGGVDVVYAVGASALGYARARGGADPAATAPLVFNPQGLEEFGATSPERASLKRVAYFPLQQVVRYCARRADCVIATDTVLAPVVQAHLDVEPARIRVVPNGIDLAACDRLAGPADGRHIREAAGIPAATPVLVSVGRLERNKGFDVLAAALARLDPALDWRWVLIGDGPMRPALERLMTAPGLAGRGRLLGRADDRTLHAWYEGADLFVHPTLYEGSSLVTLEAMAHARAVVATTAGGLPDKVQPGVNGWVVSPGDVDGLAAALADAIGSPDRRRFGAASRVLVERRFAWTQVTDAMLSVYKEALAGAAPRRAGAHAR